MKLDAKVTAERLAQLFGAECVGKFDANGEPEAPVVSPATLEAAADVLRFASRERLRVLPAGAGEHLYMGAPRGDFDLVLSTRRLRRLVEYWPEDMTVVVEAGVTLHDLDALVEPHGQRLAPDPWPGRVATVGGAVAANRAGLNRLRWGTPRDIVLGMRVLHADGRTSKTGGKVVKNVAGYDLGKLYVGSCGSLAVLAEVNVRLASRPPESSVVLTTLDRAHAETVLLALHRSALVPSSLLLLAGDVTPGLPLAQGQVALVARFEGGPRAVRWQAWECLRLCGGSELVPERARALYDALRRFSEPDASEVLLRISSLPVAVFSVLTCIENVRGVSATLVAQCGVGSSYVRLRSQGEARSVSALEVDALRERLAAVGARLAIEFAPAGSSLSRRPAGSAGEASAGAARPADLALALQWGTKTAFDPEGRFRAAPIVGETG